MNWQQHLGHRRCHLLFGDSNLMPNIDSWINEKVLTLKLGARVAVGHRLYRLDHIQIRSNGCKFNTKDYKAFAALLSHMLKLGCNQDVYRRFGNTAY
jgi:hypothetical protein